MPETATIRPLHHRVQVLDCAGRHIRWVDPPNAESLLAIGYEARGRRDKIYAISAPLPAATRAAIAHSAGRSRARDVKPALPTPKPMTSRAEASDNPPRVIRLLPVSAKLRAIFLSALIGRAGILAPPERRLMRAAIMEGRA